MKEKSDKFELIKIKNILSSKDTGWRVKTSHRQGESICKTNV